MELWDLYNEKKERIGKDHIRGEKVPDGCYHLAVRAWIHNSNGQYLIAQRSADRNSFPLLWECVGGSVLKGETSLHAVIREVKEEVGIDLNEAKGRLMFTEIRKQYSYILDGWFFHYDGDIPLEQATTKEVEQAEWMSLEQIQELYKRKLLIHSLDYFFGCKE